MTRKTMWLITEGQYEDCSVIAAAPSRAEAKRYVDAYKAAGWNAADMEDVDIEPVELYEDGDPLPRQVTTYCASSDGRTWTRTDVVTEPDTPQVVHYAGEVIASYFPTPEAALKAIEESP